MLPYITWKDFYSVGDSSLDAEHKQIIDAINELCNAASGDGSRTSLKPIVDRLVQYTLAHFKHEERMMQDAEYPDFAEHKLLHDRLREKTIELREHVELITGRDLLRFLKEWWLTHIQGQDKKYKPYLEFSPSRRY